MIACEMFTNELNAEAVTTRKFMSAVPTDKLDWKPHPKSMSLRALATHIAELPEWIALVMTTSELDFEKDPYVASDVNSTSELQQLFEKALVKGRDSLSPENEAKMNEIWTIRSGESIFSTTSKADMIRQTFNQIVHHRAQLGVYLRLLDIKVPATYGPSADDPGT